jgi:alanine racemase
LSEKATTWGMHSIVHVKVDTGMNRYGLLPEEAVEFVSRVSGLPGIHLEGFYTHFATADWAEPTFVRQQLGVFEALLKSIGQAGIEVPVIHAANSAAAMHYPEAHYTAIRPGIGLYGLEPSGEWALPFEIRPALTLKSKISRLHQVEAGEGIGYGRTYIAQNRILAALVPVGYGDGYHRVLSNQGCMLVRGQRAPILGRVSMDQLVVDVSKIEGVAHGDEVVLIGAQGSQRIRAEEIAALAGTINYEVTTSLLPRVLRLYRKGGEIVETASIAER